jgi:hypothetical protein
MSGLQGKLPEWIHLQRENKSHRYTEMYMEEAKKNQSNSNGKPWHTGDTNFILEKY